MCTTFVVATGQQRMRSEHHEPQTICTNGCICRVFCTEAHSRVSRPARRELEAAPVSAPSPEDNPTTTAKVELGKKVYFDPRLSLTGTVSCNSCHNVMEGGDDRRPSSMGILGRIGPRNAPTVWNSAFQTSQFWDGRSPSLEVQAEGPLLAAPEMGMPSHNFVMERIRSVPDYITEFKSAFNGGGRHEYRQRC